MKTYSIVHKKSPNKPLATLSYNPATEEFHISTRQDVSLHKLPLTLMAYAERGCYELDANISKSWVRQRITPVGRQNIGQILRAHSLSCYDEMAMLEMHEGRSVQDEFMIVPVHN